MNPPLKYLRTALGVVFSLFWIAPELQAAPGNLDPTFGTGGKVTRYENVSGSQIQGMVVQPDGKILVCGRVNDYYNSRYFAVTRYNADGSFDGSFGTNGGVALQPFSWPATATCVALQSDGKIVVGGNYFAENNTPVPVVARFTSNGQVDSTFGPGGQGWATATAQVQYMVINAIAVNSSGRIYLGGYACLVWGPPNGEYKNHMLLLAFHSGGGLDTSFNTTGIKTLAVYDGANYNGDEGLDACNSLAIQPDGKIVMGGNCRSTNEYYAGLGHTRFGLARVMDSGPLDTTFGSGGIVRTDVVANRDNRCRRVRILSDGKILAAGTSLGGGAGTAGFALARYTSSGALDASFGTGGKVTTDFGAQDASGYDMVVQADGTTVVAGEATPPTADPVYGLTKGFALASYTSTGQLNTAFGSGGKVVTNFYNGKTSTAYALAIQSGNLIAAGDSRNHEVFALARYYSLGPPEVTTSGATNISTNSATLGGTVTSNDSNDTITARGVVYALFSANPNPVLDGPNVFPPITTVGTTGPFTVNASGLIEGAKYVFKAYATNSKGTGYSTAVTFTTASLPWVTTYSNSNVTKNSASLYGYYRTPGSSAVTSYGIVYAVTDVNSDPHLGDANATALSFSGDPGAYNNFHGDPTTLAAGTSYTYRAFATNGAGTSYGNVTTFGTVLNAVNVAGGQFESPVVSSLQYGLQYSPPVTSTQQWTFTGIAGIASNTSPGMGVLGASTGQYAFIQKGGGMSQSVSFPTAGSYQLFYILGPRDPASGGGGNAAYTVTLSGGLYSNSGTLSEGYAFGKVSPLFTVTTPGTYTLTFTNTTASGDNTFYVDAVNITRVPTASSQSGKTGLEDTTITGIMQGTDPDGDAILGTVTQPPLHGQVSNNGTTFTYTPDWNYNGSDLFTLSMYDPYGAISEPTTVPLTVMSANDAPGFTLPAGSVTGPAGATWSPRGSLSRGWTSIALSSDGSRLAALDGVGGRIYTSSDFGMNWNAQPQAGIRSWRCIASSADGAKLAVGVFGGQIYTSTDFGATWTARATGRFWQSITSSADGLKLAAVDQGGYIYTSTDAGVSWMARASVRGWTSIASSADGTKLVACDGSLYTSTDSGVTWMARSGSVGGAVASSSDGVKLAAAAYGYINTSTDSGVTWIQRTNSGSQFWKSIASSSDGTKLVAAVAGSGQIYTSTDSGATWIARESNRDWAAVASSADGLRLVAAASAGDIYLSVATAPYVLTVANTLGMSTITGFATGLSSGPADEAGQGRSFFTSTNNDALFSNPASIDASTGTLTFAPAAGAIGTATVSIYLSDDGGVGNGGVDTSATQTFTINVIAPVVPTVTTPTYTNVTETAATLGGNVISAGGLTITERGVVYALTSVNTDPTIDGTGVTKVTASGTTGVFTANTTTPLNGNKSYSFKAYAINSMGTTYSTPAATFTTPAGAPTVTTPTSTNISATSATLGGNVMTDGGLTITERGVVYALTSINADPVSSGTGVTKVTAGGTTGVFTANTSSPLTPATSYSFKAYAINSVGTTYTTPVATFTTLPLGSITSTYTSATDVPLIASGVTLGGSATANLTLGFAPVSGTNLMVIKNTGLAFISGRYGNLAQGQTVALTYNGASYQFVVNYYGGTGNDLVLLWASVRPFGWGANGSGQLGNNSTTDSFVPAAVLQSGVLAGKTVIAVSAGESHSLALCSDGTVAAWGGNGYGQLGRSNTSLMGSSVPVAVNTANVTSALFNKTVVAVSAGQKHSLALCSDGTVAAWGWNANGQLGNNSTENNLVPVAVNTANGTSALFGKTVVAVSAGQNHSLALCSDGTAVAWGSNTAGELGNNSTTDRLVPVAVNTASGTSALFNKTVVAVSAGNLHNLALCSDGTAVAWGSNDAGQLGDNSSSTQRNVPVAVNTASGTSVLFGKTVVAVAAGGSHSMALCSDGTVAVWGVNGTGQLGRVDLQNSMVPVAVNTANGTSALFGKTVVAIAAGSAHSMALSSDGTAATWGSNSGGQAANKNTSVLYVTTPAMVSPVALAAGERFSLVGSGSSASHNLALASAAPPLGNLAATYTAATDVPLIASGVTLGGSATANLTLGFAPVTGTNLMVIKNTGLAFINGTYSNLAQGQAVALSYAGVTYQFVANYYGGTGNDLVLQWANVRLLAWGLNDNGQLGINSMVNSSLPAAVLSSGVLAGKTVLALSAGVNHTLALCSDGTVASWGKNDYGQLGNNSTTPSLVPVLVNTASGTSALFGKTVVAVSAGYAHNVALCSDGTVATWGYNAEGELGNTGTTQSSVPVLVNTANGTSALFGKTVVAVSAGWAHALALCSDGTLVAWGYSGEGALGNNSTTQSLAPVAVNTASGTSALFGKTVVSVAGGGSHSIALCSDGTLAAWGTNDFGQLGDSTQTKRLVPVLVNTASGTSALFGKTVVAVSACGTGGLVLCSDGTLAAWGTNSSGQMGINLNSTGSNVPVAVNAVNGTSSLFGRTVVAISGGNAHSLALCSDGTATAWGDGSSGKLGNNSTSANLVPLPVNTTTLAAGERWTLATTGSSSSHTLALAAVPPPAAPNVTTGSASGLTATGATLSGTVNAAGSATTVTFQYGTTIGSTAGTVTATPSPVSGTSNTAVSAVISGLSPHTTYHFRVVGTNTVGTTNGSDMTFTTPISNITTTYASAADVPETDSRPILSGGTATLSLGYAPLAGTNLMVVKNTGLNYIVGTFSNLAQGQAVPLSFGGTTYNFVANYFGGSGNDLVLQWAGTRLMTWGYNTNGQLGNNSFAPGTVPVNVIATGLLGSKVVVATAAGVAHSLALCVDGTLFAWGYNGAGALGDGSINQSQVPVNITNSGALAGKFVIAIAAGNQHSLALCSDGTLATWGDNGAGQLGTGNTTASNVPLAITNNGALSGRQVIAIAGGLGHSLALCSDGSVVAWGQNSNGQLGNGSTAQSNSPVAVSTNGALATRTVTSIAAGYVHSLALCSDGTVATWGWGGKGQLGNNLTSDSNVPMNITGNGVLATRTIVALSGGYAHSAAVCSDGSVATWGYNAYGQLGDNTTNDHGFPVLAVTAGSALAGRSAIGITSGQHDSVAVCSDGNVVAWGRNSEAELGNSTTNESHLATLVSRTPLAAGDRFISVVSGSTAYHNLSLVAAPANSAPTDLSLSATSITENNAANATVGSLSATDADVGDAQTFTLVSGTGGTDNASFTIEGTALKITPVADFETKSSYSVRVQADDGHGGLFAKALTITITNFNEAPMALALGTMSVNENAAINTVVGTLSTTDPDAADTFAYTLVTGAGSTDNAGFNIAGNALRITASPDFETKSNPSIRVRTTDAGGLFIENTFTIAIIDVNEAPTNIALSATSIAESVSANSTVGTLTSTDPDVGNTFTCTLAAGGTDNAAFTILGNALRLTASPDFETKSSYSVNVRSTDQGGLFFEKTFAITITNVNEPPTDIALSASSIAENNAANATVGTLSALGDPDAGAAHTFSLVAGAGSTDNASFTIAGTALKITPVANFETKSSYSVRVQADDGNGGLFAKALTITITNVNELPVVATADVGTGPATFTTLFSFTGATGSYPGAAPYFSRPVQDTDGTFYGMTVSGGANSLGTVFKMTPAGVRTTLVDFTGVTGPNPGSYPYGSLMKGLDGSFYGMTYGAQGGSRGTVFKVTTAGGLMTLVEFTGSTGTKLGGEPQGDLILGSDGNFYGMTYGGGASSFGTVFKMTPAGGLTTLVQFTGTNGANPGRNPTGSLILGSDGSFYGMTQVGGANNKGTVFKMTSAGELTTLVEFTGTTGANPGSFPRGSLVQGSDGSYYGTTQTGGSGDLGTVFKMTAAGVLTTLVEFTGISGANPGSSPQGSLIQTSDGSFYGMASDGGTNNKGTLFKMTADGVLTTVIHFSGFSAPALGQSPLGSLTQGIDGNLYGMTFGGGPSNAGTAFKLALPLPVTTAAEGSLATYTGTFSDPDGNATVNLTASSGVVVPNNSAGTWSWTATGADGPATSTVTITAVDDVTAKATTRFTFTVTNVPPAFDLGANDSLPVGSGALTRTVGFTDPGADVWSGTVNYGDGSGNQVLSVNQGAKTFTLSRTYAASGTYTVSVTVNDDDGGTLTDTYTVTVLYGYPEIAVSGNSVNITDGDSTPSLSDFTNFGSAAVTSGAVLQSFTITNSGLATLTLGTVTISGTNSPDFSVTAQPATTMLAGSSTIVQISFNPTVVGLRSATLSFTNNDSDESPFDFSLQGTGYSTATEAAAATYAESYGFTGTAAAPAATPFNDGVPNLLKYAFNMPLTGPNVSGVTPGTGNSGLPAITAPNTGGRPTSIRVEFIRRINSGLIYIPQYSVNGLSSFIPMTAAEAVTNIDANWERVVVNQPLGLPQPTSTFSRVSVSAQ